MLDQDPQAQLVYKAENEASTERHLNPVECQLLAQAIREHPVLAKRYAKAMGQRFKIVLKGVLKGTRARVSAYAFLDVIYLPKWAQTDWTICHEIAHIIHNRMGSTSGHESHGPEFCRINLDLVEHMIGTRQALTLAAAYTDNGVRF